MRAREINVDQATITSFDILVIWSLTLKRLILDITNYKEKKNIDVIRRC